MTAEPARLEVTGSDVELRRGGFIGREDELKRLNILLQGHRYSYVRISGPPAVGKTYLISRWLELNPNFTPVWFDLRLQSFPDSLRKFISSIRGDVRRDEQLLIVLDNTELLSGDELQDYLGELRRWKAVENIVFIESRMTREDLRGFEEIVLQPWHQVIPKDFEYRLSGITNELTPPALTTIIVPQIINLNHLLIEKLKREPESIYKVDDRVFEELIADLLADQGCTVELTQKSRDGGKDIIATKETEIGKIVTLVETKRYDKANPVGVKLVRELYGVLHFNEATHAMLVTTSRFTAPAKSLEETSKYKLSLKDYEDVKKWINAYGRN